MAASLLSNLVLLVGPLFMLQVYDRVLPSRSLPTLWALSGLVIGLYAVYAAIEIVRTRMSVRFARWVDTAFAPRAFEAALRTRLRSQQPQADPVRDLDSVRQFLSGSGPMALCDLPWVPIYLGAIFLLHPLLGWITLLGGIFMTVLLVVNELMARRPAGEVSKASGARSSLSDDARANLEAIFAMGMMPAVLARWTAANGRLNRTHQLLGDRTGVYTALTKSFRLLLQSAVLAGGAYLVIGGDATGGIMIAASILSSRALAPVEQVTSQWRSLLSARQGWQRASKVMDVLNTKPLITELRSPRHSMRVRNLTAGPDLRTPLIEGISFDLEAGEAMAVMGPSGSGKSTLARAVVGSWLVLRGDIRLDGSAIGHFDPVQLGRQIGYLSQRVELFSGTVAENIARLQTGPGDEAILEAAEAANVHELVASLPDGYDTRLGEGGVSLSVGQQQRIGLARALYGDPFVLVLDEPNSNLDADGEAALAQSIRSAKSRGAVVIVITHRPTALAVVDKVLLLKAGRQQAFGPKDAVLASLAPPLKAARTHSVAEARSG